MIGQPTHYTASLDERGQPMAGTLESLAGDVGGELPAGWDDRFWQWQPAGDPAGAWVPLLDAAKAAKWAAVKDARARAMSGGVRTTLADGTAVTLDSDEVSAGRLMRAAVMLRRAGRAGTIDWKMADNRLAALNGDQAELLLGVIADYHDEVMTVAETIRAAIDAATTLAELAAIEIDFNEEGNS